jgi:hypothetical protein
MESQMYGVELAAGETEACRGDGIEEAENLEMKFGRKSSQGGKFRSWLCS